MADSDNHEFTKLCPCKLCAKAYSIIEFLDVLLLERDIKEINEELKIPAETQSLPAVKGACLAIALAEYYFSHQSSPHAAIDAFTISWNKRARMAANAPDEGSEFKMNEVKRKLEDYES